MDSASSKLLGWRYCLVSVNELHLPLLRNWRNSPHVNRTLLNQAYISEEAQLRWYSNLVKDPTRRAWVIESMDGVPVGFCQLFDIDWEHLTAEWGFYIGETEARLAGGAAEGEYLLLRYAFKTLGLHRVWCRTISTNAAVIQLHKRFGFTIEGTLRQAVRHEAENRWDDLVIQGILIDEFYLVADQLEKEFELFKQRFGKPSSSN